MRFVREVSAAVRGEVGGDYPLFIKLNANDFVEGGLTTEDAPYCAKELEFVKGLGPQGLDGAVERKQSRKKTNSP